MQARFRLGLFGIPQVTVDHHPVGGFKSRKALALLCYLAVRAQPLSRSHLADLLWGDKTEAQGRANLSRVLNNLNILFPDSIHATRDTLVLIEDRFSLDVREFQEYAVQGTADSLQTAVALYHDEFMASLYLDDCPEFEVWLVGERERWQQRVSSVLECLAGYYVRRKEFERALPFAARLLELEPWREEAHREMMRLLAQTGQKSAALQQYERARRVLAQELSVEPGAETRALYEQIRAQPTASAPQAAPTNNLPTSLTSFIGRETELARITARLNNPECRLLTLTGAGGIGKTRLALEATKHLSSSFRDGVYFVPLAPIGAGQPEFIVPAVVSALGLVPTARELLPQLLDFLQPRELLLLLDNFEHLLEGAGLVVKLLQRAPGLKIMVTSREPLSLQAEWVTRVDGLSYPTGFTPHLSQAELSHYSALRLFVERAQRVDERFELDPNMALHVIRLAQIVEGMPLALELAASRVRTTTLAEIRALVERNLDFLATTLRDVETRHRSLRAVLDWSYATLTHPEQVLFQKLSVFAGGWTLDAAQAVCAQGGEPASPDGTAAPDSFRTLEVLSQLALKSLVAAEEMDRGRRYRMLEPIREYALEKLNAAGETVPTVSRHLHFFMQLAEQAEPQIDGPQQGDWLRRLEAEHANVRAALSRNSPGPDHAEQALRLAAALRPFWHRRGNFGEGKDSIQSAMQQSETAPIALRAKAFVALGTIVWLRAEYTEAIDAHSRAVALFEEIGDTRGMASALYNLGGSYLYLGDYEKAGSLFYKSLALARTLNDPSLMSVILSAPAEMARYRGDYARAWALNEEARSMAEESGNIQLIAMAINNLGLVATRQGDYAQAVQLHHQSLELYRECQERRLVPECLEGLAAALTELRQPHRAARLMGAADALRETIGFAVPPLDQPDYERTLDRVQTALHDTFEIVWTEGHAMTMEQAIEYALQEPIPGAPAKHFS